MSEVLENSDPRQVQNKILFCEKPWQMPALALGVLVALTFLWAFYLLDDSMEFELDDLAITDLFHLTAGAAGFQDILATVPPAVVAISDGSVNSSPVGSGVIVSSSGYVISAHHLVQGLDRIVAYVDTPNGHRGIEAQVVKSVPEHDLVLLKLVTSDRFMYLKLAPAKGLQLGEPVYAVGQGIGAGPMVKAGGVLASGLSLNIGTATLSHMIRTDAVYNWGQAGGALVNGNGELAGINLPIVGNTGTLEGFALPADVIAAHFGDVINFKPRSAGAPAAGGPESAPGAVPLQGAAVWWGNPPASPVPALTNAVAASPGPSVLPAAVAPDPQLHPLGTRIGGYRVEDIIGLAVLALVAGVVGGMMSMGGGVVQVTGMMVLFGYGMYLIRPVAYLTNVLIAGAGVWRNKNSSLLHGASVRTALPWAILGVVGGYFLGNQVDDTNIRYILGVFALLMSLKVLQELLQEQGIGLAALRFRGAAAAAATGDELDELLNDRPQAARPAGGGSTFGGAVLGFPVGLVSGLLGISGGVVGVPIQNYFNGVPLRNAIANASVIVFWASAVGVLVAFAHGISSGLIDWQAPLTLAIVMAPGAYVGGLLGARLTELLDARLLKACYALIMLLIAIRIYWGG